MLWCSLSQSTISSSAEVGQGASKLSEVWTLLQMHYLRDLICPKLTHPKNVGCQRAYGVQTTNTCLNVCLETVVAYSSASAQCLSSLSSNDWQYGSSYHSMCIFPLMDIFLMPQTGQRQAMLPSEWKSLWFIKSASILASEVKGCPWLSWSTRYVPVRGACRYPYTYLLAPR